MNQIVAFDFESHNVRIVLDACGQPQFVGTDVCDALAIRNSRDAIARLDEDEKGVAITDTLGGKQELSVINESGLYSLILTSRKSEAKRFKRWVTHEVLPSIRKTGGYATPSHVAALPAPAQDRVNAILMIGEAIAKVPGVKPGIAMAATLTCIQDNTGLVVEQLRRALPVASEPICCLNPTQLGERIGLSARSMNLRLQTHGFQFKNDRDEWELTEAGQVWAEALPYSRHGHSGYQLLWNPEVSNVIKEAA